jgi:Tfp pilus assembly protein PilV
MSSILNRNQRRGFSLIEATTALAILAGGFVLTAQILSIFARQRQAAEQLLIAQLEAANVLERIAVMPFEEVNSGSLGKLTLPKDAQAALVGGKVTATVEESSGDGPKHKRIHVEVAWPLGAGPMRTVKLTAWKYEPPLREPGS